LTICSVNRTLGERVLNDFTVLITIYTLPRILTTMWVVITGKGSAKPPAVGGLHLPRKGL